jgi:peptidyl-prolyl cis-trans isomerase A (cyclophilin A)
MTGLFHKNGSVSLGREALGTANGGDFFICIGDQPALDYGGMRNPDGQGFAVFGQVIKGMDLVHNIKNMTSDAPVQSPYDKYFLGQVLDHPIRIIQAYRKSIDIAMGPN